MNEAKKPCCGGEPEKRSPQKAFIPAKELSEEEIKREVKIRYDEFAKEGGLAEGCCPLARRSH